MTTTANPNTDGKVKIYRITFRAKIGTIPVAGDIDIQTKKEKWEIDHEAIVEKMILEQGGGYSAYCGLIDCEQIS